MDKFDGFSIIENLTSFFSILGNCLALDVVVSADIGMAGYRRFLISLLVSDLFICGVVLVKTILTSLETMPFFLEDGMELRKCFGDLSRSLEITGFIAYLLNLCCMFVDHYIAMMYPHRYRLVTGKWFVKFGVFFVWPIAFIIGFITHPVRALLTYFGRSSSSETSNSIEDTSSAFEDSSTVSVEQEVDDFLMVSRTNLSQSDAGSDVFLELVRNRYTFVDGSWCASFDRTSNLWLDWIVVILATCAAVFLIICYRVFKRAVMLMSVSVTSVSRTRRRLGELAVTTSLLLAAFLCLWMPFTIYELSMEVILQTNHSILSTMSLNGLFEVSRILRMLFIFSPLLVPIIYVTRLSVVQRQIVKRYGAILPKCVHQKLARIRTSTNNSTTTELLATAAFELHLGISRTPNRRNALPAPTPETLETPIINNNL